MRGTPKTRKRSPQRGLVSPTLSGDRASLSHGLGFLAWFRPGLGGKRKSL